MVVAFSVFSWLFLSLFPVLIVRDLEMHRAMRWPFYFLSSLSLVLVTKNCALATDAQS